MANANNLEVCSKYPFWSSELFIFLQLLSMGRRDFLSIGFMVRELVDILYGRKRYVD